MGYHTVNVSIEKRHAKWFIQRNVYPPTVQLNESSAIFDNIRYGLHRTVDGWTAISKMLGTVRMTIGEFNEHTIRRITSRNADRECRVIRAAVLNLPYECPRGYRIADYTVVHPGPCWEFWRKENPKLAFRVIRMISEHNNDDLCPVCEEGFE